MKKYEKPMLIALSLDGNERLCGDCADKGATKFVWNDSSLQRAFAFFVDKDGNNLASASELSNAFSTPENECSSKVDYNDYCKFNGASANTVAWS